MGENGPEKGGTVSPISVFVRFSVDDWHKRTKKCASLYDNASVCTGEKKNQTLAWAKIFCFVFVEEKDTFKNALVWSGLKGQFTIQNPIKLVLFKTNLRVII